MDNKTTQQTTKAPLAEVQGVVVEALPNTLFRVQIEGKDEPVLAYLAGKMRLNRIRVLLGDTVTLQLEPYGGKARITRRK
jgi:translation initiation factor IF-1